MGEWAQQESMYVVCTKTRSSRLRGGPMAEVGGGGDQGWG